jgi:hypothetical protein
MMKSLTALAAFVTLVHAIPSAHAQSARDLSVRSICRPVQQLAAPFFAGLSQIDKIHSVEFKMDASRVELVLNVEVFEKGYGATPSRSVLKTEVYQMAKPRTGAMIEWSPMTGNEIEIPVVLSHHIEVDVQTAGPIPPGTHRSTIDLVLVSSYPTGRLTTGVLHMPLTCQETYTY